MKIAVFGATLQAAVMSALSAEMGHFVSWCPESDLTHFELGQLNFDSELTHAIEMQLSQNFLQITDQAILEKDFDVYLFAFNPSNFDDAIALAESLSQKAIIHPKLMINGSTFGFNGTSTDFT